MARVLVAFPTREGRIHARTAASLCNLDWGGDEVDYEPVIGCYVDEARRKMADMAIAGGYDYLMMVDSDMILPPDALSHLREDDVNVAFGWYVRGQSDEGLTNAVKPGTQGFNGGYYAREIALMAKDHAEGRSTTPLLEVKGNGMGCALIRVDLFGRMKRPWFKFIEHNGGPGLGEDYYFCQRCSEIGVRLYVDVRVGCGHIHERVLEAK